jgi:hypothetical protein
VCLFVCELQIIEAFGAGTAAVVSPIKCIHYRGKVHLQSLRSFIHFDTHSLFFDFDFFYLTIHVLFLKDYHIPLGKNPGSNAGELTQRFWDTILGIQVLTL